MQDSKPQHITKQSSYIRHIVMIASFDGGFDQITGYKWSFHERRDKKQFRRSLLLVCVATARLTYIRGTLLFGRLAL